MVDQVTIPPSQTPGVPLVYERNKAVADGEDEFDVVDDAVDAASDTVIIGPGTYGTVSVNTAGLDIIGAGPGTVIDGGGFLPLSITADDVTVSNLAATCETTSGDFAVDVPSTHNRVELERVYVLQSGSDAINLAGGNCTAERCVVRGTTGSGIVLGARSKASGCQVVAGSGKSISNNGVEIDGPYARAVNNTILDAGNHGIAWTSTSDWSAASENRIENPTNDGFVADGEGISFSGNTVTGANTVWNLANATNPSFGANSPSVPEQSITIPEQTIQNGNTYGIVINFNSFVFPTEAGVQDTSGNAPTDLTWEIVSDPHGSPTVEHSGNTKHEEISHSAGGSELNGDVEFRINNSTGGEVTAQAHFEVYGT